MRLSKGIFITGTDTGVGKTIVSSTLARLLRMKGINVGVMKPATSGCRTEQGRLVSDDALLLCRAAGTSYNDVSAPYLMVEPLAPAEAARIDGVNIDFAHLQNCYDRLAAAHDFVIVEGAGGLMVPLSENLMTTDLARQLDLPLLVVARPNLGTINHTLLTCYAVNQMKLKLAGVIINNYPDQPGLAEKNSIEYIAALCGAPLLGVWPHRNEQEEFEAVEKTAEWLYDRPETALILKQFGLE